AGDPVDAASVQSSDSGCYSPPDLAPGVPSSFTTLGTSAGGSSASTDSTGTANLPATLCPSGHYGVFDVSAPGFVSVRVPAPNTITAATTAPVTLYRSGETLTYSG